MLKDCGTEWTKIKTGLRMIYLLTAVGAAMKSIALFPCVFTVAVSPM
jgi:hypothetical protein